MNDKLILLFIAGFLLPLALKAQDLENKVSKTYRLRAAFKALLTGKALTYELTFIDNLSI